MSGLLPYIIKYSGEHYSRNIRIEAAFFIVQVFTYSRTARKMFLAAGGILVFSKFLDLSMDENKDINFMAIDCIYSLIQHKLIINEDLLEKFVKLGIPERLAVVVDILIHEKEDQISYKFLQKTLDILCSFAAGPQSVQESICAKEILPLLLSTSHYFDIPCLIKICVFLKNIALNPVFLNRLENIGIVPFCAMQIKTGLEVEPEGSQVFEQ